MKHRMCIMAILALMLTIVGVGFVHAAQDTKTVTLNATVSASATLTLTNTTINFANATPNGSAIAGDTTTTVHAQFRSSTASPGTLSVAAPDLADVALDHIPITAVKTTAAGDGGGFFDTTAGIAWSNGGTQLGTAQSGDYQTTLSYTLDNSWSYKVGSYTTTATYTLTAI